MRILPKNCHWSELPVTNMRSQYRTCMTTSYGGVTNKSFLPLQLEASSPFLLPETLIGDYFVKSNFNVNSP